MNPMAKVAAQTPDVAFEHATGYTQADNLAIYHTRAYESRYLVGMAAGAMGDSMGVVGSYPIPEVLRGINAMTLGAREVNPDFEVRVVWISTWFDPGAERQAADALLDQGVDVLAHFTDSPAVVQAAEERGADVVALGDMKQYGETAQLTALVYNWGPYYVERTKAVLDGTWETSNTWEGIGADMMTIADFAADVPEEARDRIMAKKAEIGSGAFHPFQGPLVAQDGTVVVPEGELPSDEMLLSMDFYVEGVQGSLP
jgi:simple sugar transport system substrate-binding protein